MATRSIEQRFWEKVDRSGGPDACWPWTASACPKGYGRITVRSRQNPRRAHRVAWELTKGEIPKGDGYHGNCICHRCDNPRCVNPEHLFLGTQQDNIRDRNEKGRTKPHPQEGTKNPNVKLTDAIVRAIRADTRSQKAVGASYGVSQSLIWMIRHRKIWTHVR